MKRRALITSLTATTLSAGCLSPVTSAITPSVRLGWFGVHNADTESSHRFDLEVRRDGTRVHFSSHRVEAAREFESGGQRNAGAVAECEWGDARGDYAVRVRADGNEWVEESVTQFAETRDADCVVADAEYRSSLTLVLEEGCERDDYERMCSFTD